MVVMTAETPKGDFRAWGYQYVNALADYRPTLRAMRSRLRHDLRAVQPVERAVWKTAVTDEPEVFRVVEAMAEDASTTGRSIDLTGFPGLLMVDNGI